MRGHRSGAKRWATLCTLVLSLMWCSAVGAQATSPPATTSSGSNAVPPEAPKKPEAGGKGSGVAPSALNPEANEFPTAPVARPPIELDRLLAEIAALRSRVSALMTSLFRSKLVVSVESSGDEARIVGLIVTLDGGVIYSSDTWLSDEQKQVYEHSVAPGHHVLGIQIERVAAGGKQYRSFQQSRFSIQVPNKKRLEANFYIEDDSDMASSFPNNEAGEYSLQVDLFARVVE